MPDCECEGSALGVCSKCAERARQIIRDNSELPPPNIPRRLLVPNDCEFAGQSINIPKKLDDFELQYFNEVQANFNNAGQMLNQAQMNFAVAEMKFRGFNDFIQSKYNIADGTPIGQNGEIVEKV